MTLPINLEGKSPIGLHFLDIGDVNEMSRRITAYNPTVVHFVFTNPTAVIEVMRRHPNIIGIYSFNWGLWDNPDSWIGSRNNFPQLRRYIAGRYLRNDQTGELGRNLTPEEDARDTMGDAFNPVDAVDEFFKAQNGNQNYFVYHAEESIKRRLYLTEYNETSDNIDRVRFMKAFCERVTSWGLKACIWNAGVGHDPRFDVWSAYGLLDTLRAGGHLIGWHGYFQVMANLEHNTPIRWENGRQFLERGSFQAEYAARKVYPATMTNTFTAFRVARHHGTLKNMGYGDLKFVATEAGADAASYHITGNYVGYGEIGAWQGTGTLRFWNELGFTGNGKSPAKFYAEQLAFMKEQYLQYKDFNIGGTIFISGVGHNQDHWRAFDISLIESEIIAELNKVSNFGSTQPTPDPDPEPDPDPDPEPNPEDGNWLYLPDTITLSNGTKVSVNSVNVRTAPVVEPNNIIRVVEKGERLKALGFTRDTDGDIWYKVLVDGKEGYMSGFWTRIQSINTTLPDLDNQDSEGLALVKADLAATKLSLQTLQIKLDRIIEWYNNSPLIP